MTRDEYILRSLQKISNKRWELFIISRIIHLLDDEEIEFSTQQLVKLPNGNRAFTDLYFPQFALHLEIDEMHHIAQLEDDEFRSRDIVDVSGHEIDRIRVYQDEQSLKPLEDVCAEVDRFIERLRQKKAELIHQGKFKPWDFETRYLAEPIIQRGYVAVEDNVTFKTQVEALKCFGFKGRGYQRGGWQIPDGSGDCVWFPRLYNHGMWNNSLEDRGRIIAERAINDDGIASIRKQTNDIIKNGNRKMIVFAKSKDVMGANLLRYVGTFEPDLSASDETVLIFRRIATREPVRILEKS